MILILRIIESMVAKYTTFEYSFEDLVVDLVVLVVAKVMIDFLIWL